MARCIWFVFRFVSNPFLTGGFFMADDNRISAELTSVSVAAIQDAIQTIRAERCRSWGTIGWRWMKTLTR
jgi:hypothetical protein